MHEARLSFLAQRHAPERTVIHYARDGRGNYLTLDCGHSVTHAPHFDSSATKTVRCRDCGRAAVKSLPEYQNELSPAQCS